MQVLGGAMPACSWGDILHETLRDGGSHRGNAEFYSGVFCFLSEYAAAAAPRLLALGHGGVALESERVLSLQIHRPRRRADLGDGASTGNHYCPDRPFSDFALRRAAHGSAQLLYCDLHASRPVHPLSGNALVY